MLHVKESEGYRQFLGIDADRMRYVPYIVKQWELVDRVSEFAEDYILACGQSRRDYATFIRAVQDLPYQVKILAPKQQHLNFHVSDNVHDLRTLPKNVEILQDDGTYSSWLKVMAGCKILVIPINARSMYAEGVGTFLAAMALRKCVVISYTDAAKGIIDSGQAVLVPQGDAESLKHAITRVWENDEFRNQVAAKGHEHAIGAGDEKVLARRFFQETIKFLGHP